MRTEIGQYGPLWIWDDSDLDNLRQIYKEREGDAGLPGTETLMAIAYEGIRTYRAMLAREGRFQ